MRQLKHILARTSRSLKQFGHPRVSVAWQDMHLVYRQIFNQAAQIQKDLVGKKLEDVIGDGDESRRLSAVKQRVIRTGKAHHEIVTLPIGGQMHTFDLAIEPTFGDKGEVDGLMSVSIDITDLVAARESLEDANRRLIKILDETMSTTTQARRKGLG